MWKPCPFSLASLLLQGFAPSKCYLCLCHCKITCIIVLYMVCTLMSSKNHFGWACFTVKNWISSPTLSPTWFTWVSDCFPHYRNQHLSYKRKSNRIGAIWISISSLFISWIQHKTQALKTLKIQLHSWYKVIQRPCSQQEKFMLPLSPINLTTNSAKLYKKGK